MKTLTVAALLCTIMALTKADAETELVKRSYGCSRGWTKIRGRCYHYVSRPMRWVDAEKNCQRIGGNLASIHNYREHRRIQMMIFAVSRRNRETWIGGSDAVQERVWLWSNGRKFIYQSWCRGEPNNSRGRQHCLQMNHSGRRCWDDDMCYRRKPSVCVKRHW